MNPQLKAANAALKNLRANRISQAEVDWCPWFWGSHGCCLLLNHEGPCLCDCAFGKGGEVWPGSPKPGGMRNVGAPPYYGPNTRFFI